MKSIPFYRFSKRNLISSQVSHVVLKNTHTESRFKWVQSVISIAWMNVDDARCPISNRVDNDIGNNRRRARYSLLHHSDSGRRFCGSLPTQTIVTVMTVITRSSSGGPKPWEVYTTTDPSSSQTVASTESPGKNVGTSLNAISFGFVATAILIAMFLIMAIFEHLLRPRSEDGAEGSVDTGPVHILEKLASPLNVSPAYANDISILMPGQHCPTFIAKPAPLPCRREGIYWPSYDQSSVNFASP